MKSTFALRCWAPVVAIVATTACTAGGTTVQVQGGIPGVEDPGVADDDAGVADAGGAVDARTDATSTKDAAPIKDTGIPQPGSDGSNPSDGNACSGTVGQGIGLVTAAGAVPLAEGGTYDVRRSCGKPIYMLGVTETCGICMQKLGRYLATY
jgi:hypothetical protein